MIYRDLVSWVASRALPLRFLKISDIFALFFDKDDIVKLGIDHTVCEEIAATDG